MFPLWKIIWQSPWRPAVCSPSDPTDSFSRCRLTREQTWACQLLGMRMSIAALFPNTLNLDKTKHPLKIQQEVHTVSSHTIPYSYTMTVRINVMPSRETTRLNFTDIEECDSSHKASEPARIVMLVQSGWWFSWWGWLVAGAVWTQCGSMRAPAVWWFTKTWT